MNNKYINVYINISHKKRKEREQRKEAKEKRERKENYIKEKKL